MAERTIAMHIVLGEPAVGLWCDKCALPSRVTWPLYGVTEYSVCRIGREVSGCTECGEIQGV